MLKLKQWKKKRKNLEKFKLKRIHVLYAIAIYLIASTNCHAQAPELTQLDQDLSELAKQIKEVGQTEIQGKYQYIQQQLQKAANIFNQVLLLRSEHAAEDNPFNALAREFQKPEEIDTLTLKAHAKNIGDRTWETGNLLPAKQHQAAYKYFDQILKIFEQLSNKQLWPSEQLFIIAKAPLKEIQQQLRNSMAALEIEEEE